MSFRAPAVAKGGGATKHVFHVLGPLSVHPLADAMNIAIDQTLTIRRARARLKTGPQGSSVILRLWHNDITLVTTLTFPPGSVLAASDGLSVQVEDGDWLAVEIPQVGNVFPGRHLTLVVVME